MMMMCICDGEALTFLFFFSFYSFSSCSFFSLAHPLFVLRERERTGNELVGERASGSELVQLRRVFISCGQVGQR